jgi:hypothetical protein
VPQVAGDDRPRVGGGQHVLADEGAQHVEVGRLRLVQTGQQAAGCLRISLARGQGIASS